MGKGACGAARLAAGKKKEITDKEKIRSPYEKVDGRDYSLVEGNMRISVRCSDK
jgi:hypothetical protein